MPQHVPVAGRPMATHLAGRLASIYSLITLGILRLPS
ncbi:hypothetical protein CHELA40_10141 [Chelatococcus asaccharovorans]|nr:hypothetical protein CHELA40_10141 [Chelatococcus asaccharovorans]CAH1687288.1 hypothetical protein CHELA17_65467 [Chelatococcus asaccharovorans]